MVVRIPTRSVIVRAATTVVAALGLAAVGGCSSGPDLVSSTSAEYHSPVWVGDALYSIVSSQGGSDRYPALMRIREGGRPEWMDFRRPDCQGVNDVSPSLSDIVAVSDHEIGLVLYCLASDEGPAQFVRWDFDSGQSATVAHIDFEGRGIAWSAGSRTAYFPAYSCAGYSMNAVGGRQSSCFGGDDILWPAAALDGSVVYLANRCGTDTAEPAHTYAVCRFTDAGGASTLGRGVRLPMGLTVYGDQIVVAGEVHGKTGGWRLTAGRFDRVVDGDCQGVSFNRDGTRLAVVLRNDGIFSTTWSLRVVAVPRP
jgi:hypothetical protein